MFEKTEEKTKGPLGKQGAFFGGRKIAPSNIKGKILAHLMMKENIFRQKGIKKNSTMQYFFRKKMRFVEFVKKVKKKTGKLCYIIFEVMSICVRWIFEWNDRVL